MREIRIGRVGYIYVIEASSGDSVKIGRSASPEYRLKTLRSMSNSSGRTWVSPLQCNCSEIENKCHKLHRREKVNGEWFSISFEKAVDSVKGLLTQEPTEEELKHASDRAKAYSEKTINSVMKTFHRRAGDDDTFAIGFARSIFSLFEMNLVSADVLVGKEASGGLSDLELVVAICIKKNYGNFEYAASMFCDAYAASSDIGLFERFFDGVLLEAAKVIREAIPEEECSSK